MNTNHISIKPINQNLLKVNFFEVRFTKEHKKGLYFASAWSEKPIAALHLFRKTYRKLKITLWIKSTIIQKYLIKQNSQVSIKTQWRNGDHYFITKAKFFLLSTFNQAPSKSQSNQKERKFLFFFRFSIQVNVFFGTSSEWQWERVGRKKALQLHGW